MMEGQLGGKKILHLTGLKSAVNPRSHNEIPENAISELRLQMKSVSAGSAPRESQPGKARERV